MREGKATLLLSKLVCLESVKMTRSTDEFRTVSALVFSKWYDLVFDSMTFLISDNQVCTASYSLQLFSA